MNSIDTTVDLATIARDNEGFLLDPDDWSPSLARALAREAGLALGDEHWQIIDFIRASYARTQTVPEARMLLRFMREYWGDERGTRRYLYRLFPTGYGQTACKIAGMRKPLKLMLDVRAARNHRLGNGGGYYDRSLGAAEPRPFAVGVGFGCVRIETIYPLPHDIPMAAVLLPD